MSSVVIWCGSSFCCHHLFPYHLPYHFSHSLSYLLPLFLLSLHFIHLVSLLCIILFLLFLPPSHRFLLHSTPIHATPLPSFSLFLSDTYFFLSFHYITGLVDMTIRRCETAHHHLTALCSLRCPCKYVVHSFFPCVSYFERILRHTFLFISLFLFLWTHFKHTTFPVISLS